MIPALSQRRYVSQAVDFASGLVASFLDRAFMFFYKHVYKNTRRIARLMITFLPLMMLLVGSCKTSEAPAAYGSNAGPVQFRTALFPDRVNYTGDQYYPAAGYIDRARRYVSGTPAVLAMLTETEVTYLFGAPRVARQDADARIWQYQTAQCTADFFFYGAEGQRQVSYVDYRSRDGFESADATPCLKAIISSYVPA